MATVKVKNSNNEWVDVALANAGDSTILLSGNLEEAFTSINCIWNNFFSRIKTEDVTSLTYAFDCNAELESIPLVFNCKESSSTNLRGAFRQCYKLKELPVINNANLGNLMETFYSCESLREIPDSFCENWTITTHTGSQTFRSCYSLRKISNKLLSNFSGSAYSYLFSSCYALDYINNLYVKDIGATTSNMFTSTFSNCFRLELMRFQRNSDGTPKTAQWKNQTIDLSTNVGYAPNSSYITGYNSGITADKEATAVNKYDNLRDNADWFTCREDLSRYNIVSAVDTIKSLPDTSAYIAANGGTNTIKFKGAAGSNTMWGRDASTLEILRGKSISDMDEEDIAIATAKGWTVSFV